jgi:glycosyltransferase involved in cell wall biosynthesis
VRILLLNQTFYPDPVAVSQHLADLAIELTRQGHEVTVLASRRGYDDPSLRFPAREEWNGVTILRIPALGLGKEAKWKRAVTFAAYIVTCAIRLAFLPRFDVVVALTAPPLISFLGALRRRLIDRRFVFWVMDLNPDQAVAAGWLRSTSLSARVLSRVLRFALQTADDVVVLDRFMRAIVASKGVPEEKLTVIAPWSHDDVRYDERARDAFRREHGLEGKFVVMYAGNHSPCNPLDTLVAAARQLSDQPDIAFCFVGGGSEFRALEREQAEGAARIVRVPYQSREKLSGVLSAADLHVVTLGEAFRGLIHPCKIYNVLRVDAPVIYIGPEESHVTDLLDRHSRGWIVPHGKPELVVRAIRDARMTPQATRQDADRDFAKSFSQEALLPLMVAVTTDAARANRQAIAAPWRSAIEGADK